MRRTIWTMIPLICATGCTNVGVSDRALCAGLARPATEHAAALAEDGGPLSVVTGARLIRMLDAGCGREE